MQKLTAREGSLFLLLFLLVADVSIHYWQTNTKSQPGAAKQILKLRGYEFDDTSFFDTAAARDLMAIRAFLDGGMNVNTRRESDGRTVLINAAARGDLLVVKTLLERGADVNAKDTKGYTALSHALQARYDEVCELLLSQPRLDPNARGLNGATTLMTYVWRERKDAVQRLLDRGADVNAQDNDGDGPLHGAAQTGNVEIMDLLLAKDANANSKNKLGGTPLMWAAVYGHGAAARRLLEHGADPKLKDAEGFTARDWAIKNKREDVARLLQRTR